MTDDKGERQSGKSDVRERVTRHLRSLLMPAMVTLTSCRGGYSPPVVCDPLPEPAESPDSSAPPPPNGAAGDAGGASSAPTTMNVVDTAPVVCDPLPPPPARSGKSR
jgi:hypothetical protein